VVVHLPAPRIWKVTHGASTLYIVGRIGLLPSGVQWNKAPIEKIMDHADRFIVPSYVTMSGIGELWGRYLPLGRELDDELSDSTRAKLDALLERLHRSPRSLDRFKAAPAAYEILSLLPGGRNVLGDEPLASLRSLAERKNLEVTEAFHGNGKPLLAALDATPEDRGLEILDKAIDQADDYLDHAGEFDDAWRKGDLDAIRQGQRHPPNPMTVMTAAPEAQADMNRQEHDRFLDAVEAALAKPGVTVTVYGVDELRSNGAFLTKLRADGYAVTEPGS